MNRPEFGRPTRRTVLTNAGILAVSTLLPGAASGQPAAPGGFGVIRARPIEARLRGAESGATPIWGYEGVPGPLLRVRRGEEVRVRLINELPAETTIHWHGVRLPNAMDGVPALTQAPVAPGGGFDYRFTPPDAGTFWYRPAFRSPGLDHGLCGLLIVDEPQPLDVDRDVALVLDQWQLGTDRSIAKDGSAIITVNGLPTLDIPVAANERVRLRLLNAADARFITLRIDRHSATVMAIDGQPAEPFVAREGRITLAPGNRLDLFIDATLEPGSTAPILLAQDAGEIPVARLVYDAKAKSRPAPRSEMAPLPANPLPERMDFRGALRADLTLDGSSRETAAFGARLCSVKRGRTVMLAIANRGAVPYTVHIHGHHARLLDALDDGWKPFWLDTVLAVPQQITRVAFVADNPGKWLLHARPVGAGGNAMPWFEVT